MKLTNKILAALPVAACLMLIACNRDDSGLHQQVIDRITHAEEMLDKVDLDSCIILLQETYDFSQKNNYQWGMAEACLDMARTYFMADNTDSALAMLDKGMTVYKVMPDSVKGEYYAEYAAEYGAKGEMRTALDYLCQALPLIKANGDDEGYCITCANAGIYYRHLGMNDSALYYYQEGMDLAIKTGDLESQAMLANNLAVLYGEMGRYDESLKLIDKAIENAQKVGDLHEELSDYGTKGDMLVLSERYEEAADVLLRAINRADSTTNPAFTKARLLIPLLKALYHSKRPEHRAQYPRYMALSEQLLSQIGPNGVQGAGLLMTRMVLQIDEKHYAQAMQSIGQLEEIMKHQVATPIYKFYGNKAKCLAGLGRYQEAYDAMRRAYDAADSIKNKEITDKLSQLSNSYEMVQKELEVARLNEQHNRNQTHIAVLTAILLALLAALGALALWIRQRRARAQVRETRRWIEGIEQERARFARELHDGACNELLAIGMQLRAATPDVQGVNQQIGTLRAQLRNLSHELMPPQFTGGVRLDQALQYYLSHIDGPQVNFHADGTGWEQIPADTAYQVYRITQEAIGNIITHQPDAVVKVDLAPGHLDIVSTGAMVKGDGKGIGLQSMKGRADSIAATLITTSQGDTFALTLDFPTA